MCIQTGDIGANDDGPKSPDDLISSSGDPAATGVLQGTHPESSLPAQAPDVAPFLNKFTSFGYQIASGMVSTGVYTYICTTDCDKVTQAAAVSPHI